jgi:hypothetical protein
MAASPVLIFLLYKGLVGIEVILKVLEGNTV